MAAPKIKGQNLKSSPGQHTPNSLYAPPVPLPLEKAEALRPYVIASSEAASRHVGPAAASSNGDGIICPFFNTRVSKLQYICFLALMAALFFVPSLSAFLLFG